MAKAAAAPVARERLVDVVACYMWAGVSVMLIGPPGIGKSSSVKAIAKAFGWMLRRKGIPGVTDPILLAGLPQQDESMTRCKPFPWLRDLIKENEANRRNVLLFDDSAESSRAVQTALLDVLGEKVLGDHELPYTSMTATANPIGGGLQVTPSMANRVGHVLWSITPKEQADLMSRGYPKPNIPSFEESWLDRLPAARALVAGFLHTLQDFGAPDLDGASVSMIVGPFPSPRTWELSAMVLAAIEGSNMSEDRAKSAKIIAVKSLVGPTAANAFFTFLQYPDMPRAADVLRNPRLVLGRQELFRSDRPDRAYILLNAVTRYTVASDDAETWKAAWELLGLFAEREAMPICAPFALVLHKRRPKNAPKTVPQMEHFAEVLNPGEK